MQSDKEKAYNAYLAAAARLGDKKALARLVERWQPAFLGHAYRLTGDGDLAAEAVQDAWVEITRGIDRLDDTMAFPAWALRILTRRCTKLIRGRQRRRSGENALAREPNPKPEAGQRSEDAADVSRVRRAMQALPEKQRAALGLFYLEDMTVPEIAVALQVPAGTIKTRLMHARRKLRAQLEGDDHGQD